MNLIMISPEAVTIVDVGPCRGLHSDWLVIGKYSVLTLPP